MTNGYHVHEADPYYVQALSEHRELHAAVERIRHVLEGGRGPATTREDVAEAVRLLVALRNTLARHFAQEELGGYLEEAMVRCPRLTSQAETMRGQHAEFLAEADRLLEAVATTAPPADRWSALQAGFVPFAKRLNAHEAAEDALLARAFNEDAGC